MILQSTQYSCGAAALANAARAVGDTLTEDAAMDLCTTGPIHGTNVHGLRRGAHSFGYHTSLIRQGDFDLAWFALCQALTAGRPVILLVDRDEHWVTAIGLLGHLHSGRIMVADSALGATVVAYDQEGLARRWHGRTKKTRHYGVVVERPDMHREG